MIAGAPRVASSALRPPRPVLASAAAVMIWALGAGAPIDAQRRPPRPGSEDRLRLQRLSALVDAVAAGQMSVARDVGLAWSSHYIKAPDNLVYVPYTLTLDGSFRERVDMYVRVVKRGAARGEYDQSAMTIGTWRNLTERPGQLTADLKDLRASAISKDPHAFEDTVLFREPPSSRISRALWVTAGEYDVYVAMEERGRGGKTAVLIAPLSVPDLSTGLSASSVVVADAIEASTPARDVYDQLDSPYVIDGLRITPLLEPILPPTRTLNVIFWIYNETIDVDGYPDLEVDYTFYRTAGSIDAFFNRTPPRVFTAGTVPPAFNLSAAHRILVEQSVPLQTFPSGDYRLAITVTDNVSRQSLIREVPFTVAVP